jgi:hypothetical protein
LFAFLKPFNFLPFPRGDDAPFSSVQHVSARVKIVFYFVCPPTKGGAQKNRQTERGRERKRQKITNKKENG